MSVPIISVEKLSKRYIVGHRKQRGEVAIREILAKELRNGARKALDVVRGRQIVQGDSFEEFWALRDVSFEVRQGEVLGIIGRNGAGKSTLLKLLTRITEPTTGRITLSGRVASLLEVGTGFHPELSGRENIFLNGAILGMSRAEIRKKFDEIVAFAEVERFLDTPVKRYSSGMYVRLAFAVAAHLEPDILVVDEVLAVGDADFQRKCLGKMNEASSRDGRTVLLVTHNAGIVSSLCSSAVWLDRGVLCQFGPARELIEQYIARHAEKGDRFVLLRDIPRPWHHDGRLRILSLEWFSDLPLRHGDPVKAQIRLQTMMPVSAVSIGIGFSNSEGTRLLSYDTDFQNDFRADLPESGIFNIELSIDSLPLGPDEYNVDIGIRSGARQLDYLPGCQQMQVIAGPNTPAAIMRKGSAVNLLSHWVWKPPEALDKSKQFHEEDEVAAIVRP